YKGSAVLAGQTGSSLTLNNVSAAYAGSYSVTVSGTCGNPVTSSASLTVNRSVVISSAPASVTTCPGTSASFSVSATGPGFTYQQYEGTNVLSGENNSSLTLTNVSAADAGDYNVVVSGTCGSAVTNSATLVVNEPLVIVSGPADQTICETDNAIFSASATGTG